MRTNWGIKAAAAVAVITGLAAAGCTSAGQSQAQAQPHAAVTASSAPAVVPSETEIHPSAPATLSASEAGCAPKPLVKDLRVTSVAKVGGAFRLSGYVQSVQCGAGVPDDVQYTDTGSVQSFGAAGTAVYTLRGSDPVLDYAVDATTFMAVADGQKVLKGNLGWGRGICELRFDQSGHVISVEGVYTP